MAKKHDGETTAQAIALQLLANYGITGASYHGGRIVIDAEEVRDKLPLPTTKPMPKDPWCCAKCGGTNIQVDCWVDANTDEVYDDAGTDGAWCTDCEEQGVRMVLRSEYEAGDKDDQDD